MAGISEILLLILLITALLILPRMLKSPGGNAKARRKLNRKMRIALVLSLVYPIMGAVVLKPWEGNIISFIALGIAPVALAWALGWILAAPKK